MNKLFLASVFSFWFVFGFGQKYFLKKFMAEGDQTGHLIYQTTDTNFILVCSSNKSFNCPWPTYPRGDFPFYEPIIIKISPQGNLLWYKAFNFYAGYSFSFISEAKDKNLILWGSVTQPCKNDFRAVAVKLDGNGSYLYEKRFLSQFSEYSRANSVLEINDSLLIVNVEGGSHSFIKGATFDGDTISKYKFNLSQKYFSDRIFKLCKNGFLITSTMNTDGYAHIRRTDSIGNILWSKEFPIPKSSIIIDVIGNKSNETILFGTMSLEPSSSLLKKGFFYSINEHGDSLWFKTFGDNLKIELLSTLTKFGNFYYSILNYNTIYPSQENEKFLIKFNSNYEFAGLKSLGYFTTLCSLLIEDSNSVYMTGRKQHDIIFMKTNLDGVIDEEYAEDIVLYNHELKTNTDLQIYPNPVSFFFKIKSYTKICRFEIYDIFGTCVFISDGINTNETEFNASNLSCGLYVLKAITSGSKINQIKFVKIE